MESSLPSSSFGGWGGGETINRVGENSVAEFSRPRPLYLQFHPNEDQSIKPEPDKVNVFALFFPAKLQVFLQPEGLA